MTFRMYYSMPSTFLVWFLTLIIRSESMTLQPIFDPRFTLASDSMPSRTPSAPSLVRLSDRSLEPIVEAPPVVLLPVVSRRQPHIAGNQKEDPTDILSPEPEPTCTELKAMWRKMRRMSRQMELTNEVPKLRDPFVGGAYDYRPSKYPSANPYSKAPKSSRISNVFHTNEYQSNSNNLNKFEVPLGPKPGSRKFGQILRDQDERNKFNEISGLSPRRPSLPLGFDEFEPDRYTGLVSNERVPGRFNNYPLQKETLGVYGTVVHSPEERARFRSLTRRPTDSRFPTPVVGVNREVGRGRVPFRATKPHGEFHYGSLVTHYPNDRTGSMSSTGNAGGGGNSMYHQLGGFAEYPTEVNQRFDNGVARVERFDKVEATKLKDSCRLLQDKQCKSDVDCYCIGNPKFFCGGNWCRPRFKSSKFDKKPLRNRHLYYVENPYDVAELYDLKNDPTWSATF